MFGSSVPYLCFCADSGNMHDVLFVGEIIYTAPTVRFCFCTLFLKIETPASVNNIASMDIDQLPDELIPTALSQKNDFNNFTTLRLLRREITFIMKHGIQPVDEWYEERSEYVYKYCNINWFALQNKFNNKDHTIYAAAKNIEDLLNTLMEELSVSIRFTLVRYYNMIENIYQIWNYYSELYVGDEDDDNIIDLIESMTHLWKQSEFRLFLIHNPIKTT